MTKEFSGVLCNLYIVVLAVALPLYTKGTYIMLGDDKYELFRNLSLLCLGLAAAAALAGYLGQAAHKLRTAPKKVWTSLKLPKGMAGCKAALTEIDFSPMDVCVTLYGLVTVVSALLSSYGTTAWTGYREWYMGAVSQVLFVGIYFFISRQYSGSAWVIHLWEAAFFLVAVFGFCSRFGRDPLGLMREFNSGDWEYSHLISTIGNINWFCGYCAVALAMPAAGYLEAKSRTKAVLLYIVTMLGLVLLCIQGSDVGIVLAAVCLGVGLLLGREDATKFYRTLLLAVGVAFGLPCYSFLVRLRGEAALRALPADGPGLWVFAWNGWWIAGAVCLVLCFFLHRSTHIEGSGDLKYRTMTRRLWWGIALLAAAMLLAGGVLCLIRLFGGYDWSNGRAALWRLSCQGFLRGDLKQKLLGAGPDCFAEYVYSAFAPQEMFSADGYWAGAVFANAHNQWLNYLINIGILGLGSAVAVWVAAVRRYRGCLPGILALSLYGANSLVSFEQVLSTPLFFLMLGICEYSVRRSSNARSGGRFAKNF